jgi:hypothetical protein
VEANTSHSHVATGGRLTGRSGLRGRLTALLGAQRGGKARNGGASDESTVRFDRYLRDSKAVVLHHRRLPGTRTEISHLVVGPSGVTVVDSSRYKVSQVSLEGHGRRSSVRARSNLAGPVLDQVDAVRALLADTPYAAVPIEAAVARSRVEGPRVLQGLNAPRVIVSGVRTIAVEASRKGELSARRVTSLAHFLDDALE